VQRVGTPEELAANPVGNYWLGETQLVWCADAQTCGTITWGQPTATHVGELTRALELARHPDLAGGFDVFMDTSAIEVVDWQPFSALGTYVRDRLPEWAKVIRKQAVIVPSGPAAPLLAGMVPLLGMTYPMKFFGDRDEAIAWLERPGVLEAVTEAAELAASARSLTPMVQRLRSWLEGALLDATLESAASALTLSARTLQRELQTASTSFTAEVQAARVRVAIKKLTETDEKIESIARDVGCVSASQLSALFKKHVGDTPAKVRERLRITS
jgi:methylphosphotriester-DNA--protein-cysteine methyltransferase